MRASTDCTSRAEECRRLAKLAAKPEDWQHFLEMATTWDMLAKQRPSDKLAETWALADAIANSRNVGRSRNARSSSSSVSASNSPGRPTSFALDPLARQNTFFFDRSDSSGELTALHVLKSRIKLISGSSEPVRRS
jgi:hypothetical protein